MAILAYKTGFINLKYCLASAIIFSNRLYSQHEEALAQYIDDLHYLQCNAASTAHAPEFTNLKPIQSSSDEPKTKTIATALKLNFRYAVRDGHATTEYAIFDLFHGSVFGWQVLVGLGAKLSKWGHFLRSLF